MYVHGLPMFDGITRYCIYVFVLFVFFSCFSMMRMCCEAVGNDHNTLCVLTSFGRRHEYNICCIKLYFQTHSVCVNGIMQHAIFSVRLFT